MYTALDHSGKTIMWTFVILHLSTSGVTGFENLSQNKHAAQSSMFPANQTPAFKAVDGIISQHFPDLAVTDFEKFVWWYVDLGAPRNIQNITIYYRTDNHYHEIFSARFAGFSVYISNENFTSQGGYNCAVNSRNPPTTFPIVCMNVGRYVTIYNQRPTAGDPSGAILELGEVQVFGCQNGTVYGTDCNIPCSDKCRNSWCNIINGSCFSCNDGFQGISCDQPCSEGKYGRNCIYDCSINCFKHLSCNLINGTCVEGCKPGWTGDKCDQSCSDGQYGQNCSQNCGNCLQPPCNKVNGSCDSCAPGYHSSLCKTQCNMGLYGADCQQHCSWNCKNNDTCNFITGYCNQGCENGWTNSFCSAKCPAGHYGNQCSSVCSGHCRNGQACDHATGVCNEGCKVGYYGPRCADHCSGNCKNNSNCKQSDGICINGCRNGYYGAKCNIQCSPHCKDFSFCEDKTGNCTFGCAPGWKTEKCNTECEPGEYGEDCAYSCGSCVSGTTCNPVSGHCESGCGPGYTGLFCKQACGHGLYGQNCSKNCSGQCFNFETCNIEMGKCDKGCIAGYTGQRCDEACEDGKYGQNCQVTCGYCIGREVCNKMSGHCRDCITGYKPPFCTSSSQDLPLGVGIAIGIGIVIALIMAFIIGYLLIRRCRNISSKKTSQQTYTNDTNVAYYNKDHVTKTNEHDYQELGEL